MIKPDFAPSILHPFYFIRKSILRGIEHYASELSGRMMDFGCGSKPYRSLFTVNEYVGVDFQNEGHPHDNEQIDVFYDGKSLPFPTDHFDSILATEVFEHLFDLRGTLQELNRVLIPGGKMLITCPFVWNEHEIPYDFARYSRFALKHYFEETGFSILSFRKSSNYVMTLFQLWNLYFYTLYSRKKRSTPIRWLFKALAGLINMAGTVVNVILPDDESLYLNNIYLIEKRKVQ